jgi:hypothetical protein
VLEHECRQREGIVHRFWHVYAVIPERLYRPPERPNLVEGMRWFIIAA